MLPNSDVFVWDNICLERGADCLHMVQLKPLHPKTPSSLASFKSRLVSPFWYQITQVFLEKRPLKGCVWCVCVVWDNKCLQQPRKRSMCLTACIVDRPTGPCWHDLATFALSCVAFPYIGARSTRMHTQGLFTAQWTEVSSSCRRLRCEQPHWSPRVEK